MFFAGRKDYHIFIVRLCTWVLVLDEKPSLRSRQELKSHFKYHGHFSLIYDYLLKLKIKF